MDILWFCLSEKIWLVLSVWCHNSWHANSWHGLLPQYRSLVCRQPRKQTALWSTSSQFSLTGPCFLLEHIPLGSSVPLYSWNNPKFTILLEFTNFSSPSEEGEQKDKLEQTCPLHSMSTLLSEYLPVFMPGICTDMWLSSLVLHYRSSFRHIPQLWMEIKHVWHQAWPTVLPTEQP